MAGEAFVVGDSEPTLRGFTEVGANLIERFALGMAAGKCGDRGGITAGVWFRADDGGEIDGDIDNYRRGSGRGIAHGQGPPVVVVYPSERR
jgi:hypothetical protein